MTRRNIRWLIGCAIAALVVIPVADVWFGNWLIAIGHLVAAAFVYVLYRHRGCL